MTPEDVHRRRANKRFNERVKLLATFFNNTGIATLVDGFLLPIFNGSRWRHVRLSSSSVLRPSRI